MRSASKMVGVGVFAAGVLALLAPTLVSGSARNTVGSGKAAAEAARPFVAQLTGAAEFPGPGATAGTGAAAVTIDAVTGEVCGDLRVADIGAAVAAHIHRGAVGVAGPIVVNFVAPNPTSAACEIVTPTLAAEIAGNPAGFYVNVHTAAFPSGAVRGQLALAGVKSGQTQVLDVPLRAYDSRETTDGVLAPLATRVVSLATGKDGTGAIKIAVPPGAVAAVLRITVTETVSAGFLKVYSNTLTTAPATSNVNWYETGANEGADATIAVDAEGKIKVTNGPQQTHFVINVVGYIF